MPIKAGIDFDKLHFQRIEQFTKKINQFYLKVAREAGVIGSAVNGFDTAKPFSFKDYPKSNEMVDKLIKSFHGNMVNSIQSRTRSEWLLSCEKNDELVDRITKSLSLSKEKLLLYKNRNLEALSAFQNRKIGGLSLSEKVWKYSMQVKGDIEMGIDLGLGDGRSASQLSRDLREYLLNPDKLFRRVRDKHGVLHLSKSARKYNPGAGVYRSSYKNAMRLARTEINMAYRASDYERWKNLDFVVGIEIRRSNHVFECSVCESLKGKYPKTFKFVGWHPQCRCHAISILATDEEFTESIKNNETVLSVNSVSQLPSNFNEWYFDNESRISKANSIPYWLRDNRKIIEMPHKRIKSFEEKEIILKNWKKRLDISKKADHIAKYVIDRGYLQEDVNTEYLERLLANKYTAKSKILSEASTLSYKITSMETDMLDFADYMNSPIDEVKKYGFKKVMGAVDSIVAKMNHFNVLNEAELIKSLTFEISWLENTQKYSTWRISQNYYIKKLDEVKYAYEKKIIINETAVALEFAKTTLSDKLILYAKELQDLLDNNGTIAEMHDKSLLLNKEYIRLENARLRRLKKSGKLPVTKLEQVSKQDALDMIDAFLNENESIDDIDGYFRKQTEDVWKTLTNEERNVMTKYTQTFSYLNEPLRGLPYYNSYNLTDGFKKDMPLLTKALNKFRLQKPVVVHRKVGNYHIDELGKYISEVKEGDVFTENGFLSTSMHKTRGYGRGENLVIVAPKGTSGVYAEPFSHYTNFHKYSYSDSGNYSNLWDGVAKERLGSEFEWYGNRGIVFKVIKKDSSTIYLQIVDQINY